MRVLLLKSLSNIYRIERWKLCACESNLFGQCRSLSSKSSHELSVFLPRTSFKKFVKPLDRSVLDTELAYKGDLKGLYDWQLNEETRKSLPLFELLDGPPYANGDAHVGHAINKITKDFVVRSRIYFGNRVLYRPGWDCHGLPIELQIAKTSNEEMSQLAIRSAARNIAQRSIYSQMNSFKRWGVTADWSNPYFTMNQSYVAKELDFFATLFDKKLVYRTYAPVYWSPSSRTALAESELEYKDHKSTAVYYRYVLINSERFLAKCPPDERPTKFFALIWTTMPWTLPMNNAIMYRKDAEYAIVELLCGQHHCGPTRIFYFLSMELVPGFEKQTGIPLRIISSLTGADLKDVMYRSSMFNDIAQPLISSKCVTTAVGTGLVHASYAHGFDDFKCSREIGDVVRCFVNENGCYTRDMGHDLEGKYVLGEGQSAVLQLFKKDIIHTHEHVHQYPYDWRTGKPVIVRSSEQWFIDLSEVGPQAADMLCAMKIPLGSALSDKRDALLAQLHSRSGWCISRQRCWGTPIPAFLRENGSVLVSGDIIRAVASQIAEKGTDYWWKSDADDLLQHEIRKAHGIGESEKLQKLMDVMDVWFDSGMAWRCARSTDDNPVVDLVVEGVDQFRGWFQSLLLTAFSTTKKIPYKRVLVHAFAVDEHDQKMSKSLGNVVDPDLIIDGSLNTQPLGVDGLRLWVAQYGCSGDKAKIGENVLSEVQRSLNQLRGSLSYLLAVLDGYQKNSDISTTDSYLFDRFIIQEVARFSESCAKNAAEYRFCTMINDLFQFLQRPLNAPYISSVKNRLYCGTEHGRRATQETLAKVGLNLAAIIAPILPHLATEFFIHHPLVEDPAHALRNCAQFICANEKSRDIDTIMSAALQVRARISSFFNGKDISRLAVRVTATSEMIGQLSQLQNEPRSYHSELVEILGVSMVEIVNSNKNGASLIVEEIINERRHCDRCRRITRKRNETYCTPCLTSMAESSDKLVETSLKI